MIIKITFPGGEEYIHPITDFVYKPTGVITYVTEDFERPVRQLSAPCTVTIFDHGIEIAYYKLEKHNES